MFPTGRSINDGVCSRPMRFLSWNMAHVQSHWSEVVGNKRIDVALLQEAVPPPTGLVAQTIPAPGDSWITAGGQRHFCAAVARLSDRVSLRPIATKPLPDAGPHDLGVSLPEPSRPAK